MRRHTVQVGSLPHGRGTDRGAGVLGGDLKNGAAVGTRVGGSSRPHGNLHRRTAPGAEYDAMARGEAGCVLFGGHGLGDRWAMGRDCRMRLRKRADRTDTLSPGPRLGVGFPDHSRDQKHVDQPADCEKPARKEPEDSGSDAIAIDSVGTCKPEKEPKHIGNSRRSHDDLLGGRNRPHGDLFVRSRAIFRPPRRPPREVALRTRSDPGETNDTGAVIHADGILSWPSVAADGSDNPRIELRRRTRRRASGAPSRRGNPPRRARSRCRPSPGR